MTDEFTGDRPKHEKLDKFCQYYASHHNKERAAREAGYSASWAKGSVHRYVRQYQPYISWLQNQHSKAVARILTVNKQSVIDELAKIAFANPQDYVRRRRPKEGEPEPKPGDEPLYDRIPIDELPRDLAAAIGSWTIDEKGRMTYSLLRKTPELVALAKAMGLASEKLIVQHSHAHMHAHVDMRDVPSEVLDNVEKLLTKNGVKVYENGENSKN